MIWLLSSVGMIFSILIVNMNHEQSIINASDATVELIKHESVTLIEKHNRLLEEFGLGIQNDPAFRSAFKTEDPAKIQSFLDAEFSLYYVTTNVLVINQIYAYDKQLNLISQSSKGKFSDQNIQLCAQLANVARKRRGIDRIRRANSVCYHDEYAFNSIIIPIGTLIPKGYLQIVSQPFNILQSAVEKLGMPLKIETTGHQKNYQSDNWISQTDKDLLILRHQLFDINGNTAFSILMEKDISEFNSSFERSRLLIILIVGFITLLGVSVFYYRMERHMFRPLNLLGKQLAKIEESEQYLGSTLHMQGSAEIQSITEKFNRLSQKLAHSYESLEALAYRDKLTTLPNRSKLKETLDDYTNVESEKSTSFCLLIINLDRFKTVNDTMGYHIGDQLLQQVSERLTATVRNNTYQFSSTPQEPESASSGLVSRIGGDEFAIVLPLVDNKETAGQIANEILNNLSDSFTVNQFSFNLGSSIGISFFPKNDRTTQKLMQHADIAMHHAKTNQLGTVFYDESLREQNLNVLSIDTDLRKAMQDNELSLVFQPKIDLKLNRIDSVEALLRWNHKKLGLIPPDEFIMVAEKTGYINQLTKWVFKEALKQKQKWDEAGFHFSISINISAKNLWDKSLLHTIRSELVEYKIMPQSVTLELTESALMTNPEHAIVVLNRFRDLGLRISIDDFGTGYSSLSYLKQLPIKELKIDKSFVLNMTNEPQDAVIVRSTIDLAHNMGMLVVAEGVETLETFNSLQSISCDLVQGFYIAKPLSSEELQSWLTTSQWVANTKPGKLQPPDRKSN